MKPIFAKVVALLVAIALLCSGVVACKSAEQTAVATAPAKSAEPSPEASASQPTEQPTQQPVNKEETIVFWHTYSEGEEKIFLQEIVPAFEAANPGIKIDAIRMPTDGLQQQVITAASGNAAPDVMRMDITWVSQLGKMGALEPLSAYDGFTALKENALSAPMETNYSGGKYYGLPLNTNTTVAVWNMDLLKQFGVTEPPKTLDELVALAKRCNDPAKEKWVFTIAGTYTWAILPYFWMLGGDITNADYSASTGVLNSDASIKALNTIAGWYKDGIISHAIIGEQPDAWGGMTGGHFGMISEGPWFFSSNKTDYQSKATVMPAGPAGSLSIVGGEDIVMFASSKHKEAAWKFMQYMLSDEAQLAMTHAGMIPVVKSAMDKVDTSATPYLAAYIEQLKTAKARTPSPNWSQIDSILAQTFEKVIRGETTSKEGLDAAAAQIDPLLH